MDELEFMTWWSRRGYGIAQLLVKTSGELIFLRGLAYEAFKDGREGWESPKYYTSREVKEILGVSQKTSLADCSRKRGKFKKIGRNLWENIQNERSGV